MWCFALGAWALPYDAKCSFSNDACTLTDKWITLYAAPRYTHEQHGNMLVTIFVCHNRTVSTMMATHYDS